MSLDIADTTDMLEAFRTAFMPREKQSLDDFVGGVNLPAGLSSMAGKFTYRFSPLRSIVRAYDNASVRRLTCALPVQSGKTTFLSLVALYHVVERPCPILWLVSDESLAVTQAKRFRELVLANPRAKEVVGKLRISQSASELFFDGGSLTFLSVEGVSALESRPAKVILLDEVSLFKSEAGLLVSVRNRAATYPAYKIVAVSSAQTRYAEDYAPILRYCKDADTRHAWQAKCPYCEAQQTLAWTRVRWGRGSTKTARYLCERCEKGWGEDDRREANAGGRWIP